MITFITGNTVRVVLAFTMVMLLGALSIQPSNAGDATTVAAAPERMISPSDHGRLLTPAQGACASLGGCCTDANNPNVCPWGGKVCCSGLTCVGGGGRGYGSCQSTR